VKQLLTETYEDLEHQFKYLSDGNQVAQQAGEPRSCHQNALQERLASDETAFKPIKAT
jgi:hypothetical protein